MAKKDWKLLSSKKVDFAPGENTFGLSIVKEIWDTGHGMRTYWKANRPDVVMIVPFTENGELIATKEFQPGVGAVYPKMPGGSVEKDQTPLQAARAELLEETGYEAGTMELVTTMAHDSGSSDRKVYCYLATDCRKVGEPEQGITTYLEKDPWKFWWDFMGYLLEKPDQVHGGSNSLKAVATVFAKLRFLETRTGI